MRGFFYEINPEFRDMGSIEELSASIYKPKPCLLIGTGFHRWVLGDSLISKSGSLVSWSELILQTAKEMGVSIRSDLCNENLALYWEKLLIEAQNFGVKESYKPKIKNIQNDLSATYRYELMAKKASAKVLRDAGEAYPRYSERAKYPLSDCWGAVVSLNFDNHWFDSFNLGWQQEDSLNVVCRPDLNGYASAAERRRLTNTLTTARVQDNFKRVWFPNGHTSVSSSLRLGFRDFGFHSSAIYEAFKAVKVFERQGKVITGSSSSLYKSSSLLLDGKFSEHNRRDIGPLPLTWVTEILYRPVFFAGVGMSDAEVGLWWLMVQRARNLAKLNHDQRPKAYILVHENDARLDFWKTHPCGIEPVICSNWDAGWAELKHKAEALCDFK